MTVLGVFLILLALLILVVVLLGGREQVENVLDLGLFELSASTVGVFFIGAGTVLILAIGVELTRYGVRREFHRRRELKRAREMTARHEPRPDRRSTEPGVNDTSHDRGGDDGRRS